MMTLARIRALAPAFLSAALVFGPAMCGAVAVDQIDDFEDGTVQNWFVGVPHPAPPENIPDGGPGGAGDNFMLLTALGGNGPGSRLTVINATQWAGDYLAAGVTSIEIDFWNASDVDLFMRILFEDPAGGPPVNAAITDPVLLPAGSGWVHAVYSIDPGSLIPLLGDPSLALSQATEIRLFHSEGPEYPPDPVVARLGVDNIHALGGPTPVQASSWGKLRAFYR